MLWPFYNPDRLNEYVEWSLTEFSVDSLIDGIAFPSYSALLLDLADNKGKDVLNTNVTNADQEYKYLPFIDHECLQMVNSSILVANTTTTDNSDTM